MQIKLDESSNTTSLQPDMTERTKSCSGLAGSNKYWREFQIRCGWGHLRF
jgi:hypothetical protein